VAKGIVMAEIETSIDYQLDLTFHTVSGNLTSQKLLDKLETYYQGRPTQLILWDFMNATWSGITTDELKDIIRKAKKYSRKGGKTAFVFSRDADFGIGRMVEAYAEIEGYDYEFGNFRDRKDAEKWLGIHE
jgi:putative salt-induced outer membrane protein YdiY